ncbi:MAG: LysM peptidoglycan-binding domain-containing protein [Anaerolineaceae bacterium]|nr:LysM peptidoglycan-binding domain-containing protein [Anaerolineaceae bacterium]
MKSRAWLFILLLVFVRSFPAAAQDEINDLLGRVNNLRVSLGLQAYSYNGSLAAAAQDQAQWMVDTGSISHTRPDGSSPRSRAAAAGYPSTWVSENIYGGSNATASDAWGFWINSSIHYAGITSANNREIGIGAAHGGWGAAYVLVFGNPGGQSAQPRSSGNNNGGSTVNSAPAIPEQPVYVVGTDEYGNIMHEIQPGDTMGDIALIYGYTWDDIPAILALNNLTEEDFRNLEIGTILLIPPQSGTYTPTPGEPTATVTYELPATFTKTPTPTMTPEVNPVDQSTSNPGDQGILPTLMPTPTPYTRAIVTANALPAAVALAAPTALETPTPFPTEPLPAETAVAIVATAPVSAPTPSVIITPEGTSPWLIAGLVLQVGVLAYASFEFARRMRRR